MGAIRGEQKVEMVKTRLTLPQPLMDDIEAFIAFNAELGRVLTVDTLAAAAVRDALAADKQFQAWRKSGSQPPRAP